MAVWAAVLMLLGLVAALIDGKPNILFVLADDQDLLLNSLHYMPLLRKNMIDEGTTFENYFVGTPLCCPSRASILRGQYAHNTQIIDLSPPGGGVQKFRNLGLENSTIGTWLHAAGYQTAFYGKYMNAYDASLAANYNPPGWDDWFPLVDPGVYNYYNSIYSDNGKITKYPNEYQTDTLRNRTLHFLRTRDIAKPFFIHLSGVAPHKPATPAIRHQNLFKDLKAPRKPSFDQADVSKEPSTIKTLPHLSANDTETIDELYRDRLRCLQAVDESVDAIIKELQALRLLDNTYIFYTADNGFHLGEHRLITGKRESYEEDVRVPFIVRGPGVAKNATVAANAQNIDLAPTFADLAGAKIPAFVDGKSLVPLLTKDASAEAQAAFRPIVLTEHWGESEFPFWPNNTWQSIRIKNPSSDLMFASWCTNDYQHYDISTDPYELNNTYSQESEEYIAKMYTTLSTMFKCKAASCYDASAVTPMDDAPPQLGPLARCWHN